MVDAERAGSNLQCVPTRRAKDRAHERNSMNTVKDTLAEKSGALIHVRSGDMVVEALRQMRDNRVRVGAGHRRRRTGRYRDPG